MKTPIGFVETPPEIVSLMLKLVDVPRGVEVLDSGCGRGAFLRGLKREGFHNVWGIELHYELYLHCKREFPEFRIVHGDFLTYDFGRKYDLIVGNPPYVHFKDLPPDMAKVVRHMTGTSKGDIYYAFIMRAINLLKDGGSLIYIVPYHFFYNTHARTLRSYLLKSGKMEVLIDLDEARLFAGENPETVILVFRKGDYDLKREKTKFLRLKDKRADRMKIYGAALDALRTSKSNAVFEYEERPHFTEAERWSIFSIPRGDFPSVPLKTLAKVGVGPVSGFDRAFAVKETAEFSEKERRLIRPFVKGKNCLRFSVMGYENFIVTDDSIRSEEHLRREYPNIYAHLLPFKGEMQKRYLPKGKLWFHWQALRNYRFLLRNLNRRRIYVPTLDRRPYNRFSLGEGGLLPAGDVLFIQPYDDSDLLFLLGYLNSSFFRDYYLARGGRRGGRVSFTQKLLENVEIPLFTDKVKEMIAQVSEAALTGYKDADRELDAVVERAISNRDYKDRGLIFGSYPKRVGR